MSLSLFFIYKKNGKIESKMNKYLVELEKWLFKWKMKISVEKSCSMIFTKNNKESSVFNLRIYGNRIENLKEIKFLGIRFDSKLTFSSMIEEIKERCNSRLNLIKILSNKKWGLDLNTLGNLYKSLIGSILNHSFPCLNSLSETNI